MPFDFHRDLDTLRLMASELEDYVLSEQPGWPLGGHAPQLTMGMLWLVRARLSVAPANLQSAIASANTQVDEVLKRWGANAERKATVDLRTRVNLWQAYLDDDERTSITKYATDITHRVLSALLLQAYPALNTTPDAAKLPLLDKRWRTRFQLGAFAWASELQGAFPSAEFWFLYGGPKK